MGRKVIASSTLAGFILAGLLVFGTPLYAKGPGGGNSGAVICGLLLRAIDAATAIGADDLAAYLQSQYDARGCGA